MLERRKGDRRKGERRVDIESAKKCIGMERRLDERRKIERRHAESPADA